MPAPLLGPSIHAQTSQSFHDHVSGLFIPRNKSGKAIKLSPKGRVKVSPTKTRIGIYEVEFLDLKTSIKYGKSKELTQDSLEKVSKFLDCDLGDLLVFFGKKNFSIVKNLSCNAPTPTVIP